MSTKPAIQRSGLLSRLALGARRHWKGIAIAYGVAWAVAVIFPDDFPKNTATILFVMPCAIVGALFSGFCLLGFLGGIIFPSIALFTRDRKAAEYEWHVWWSLK